MLTFTFLLVSSIVWGGLIWLTARTLQRSNVSGRARQWIWRGATLLLLAPVGRRAAGLGVRLGSRAA